MDKTWHTRPTWGRNPLNVHLGYIDLSFFHREKPGVLGYSTAPWQARLLWWEGKESHGTLSTAQCFLFPWNKVVKILGIVFVEEQPYAVISVANKFLLTAKLKGSSFAGFTAARPPGEVLGPSTSQILMLKMQTLLLVFLSTLILEMTKILFFFPFCWIYMLKITKLIKNFIPIK